MGVTVEKLTSSEKKEVRELIDLLDVAKLVVSTLEMDQVLDAILKSAMRLTNTSAGSIALFNKHTGELELHASRGFSKDFAGERNWKVRPGGLTDKILKSREPMVINDTTNKQFFTNPLAINEGIKSMVCVPLAFKDDLIGIFYVDDFSPRKFVKGELRLLSILSSFAAMSIDHAKLHERTKRLAVTDGLTELFNHRHFQEQLEREISRADRYHDMFSLMMIDIDDFKVLNDTYGHPFGDKVLQKLSGILKGSTRDSDTVSRYGGEEFTIILPKVDTALAGLMADRVLRNIKTKSSQFMRGKKPLTVSIGISTYPGDSKKKMDLIKKADKALYEAKHRGKDQAVLFHDLKGKTVG
ncbi:MAG TPA: sensor domain-containing diguanylate cyclase [Nitrospirota bacterium]|jgi:diguanylate cyclase (GGDEF)-like protein